MTTTTETQQSEQSMISAAADSAAPAAKSAEDVLYPDAAKPAAEAPAKTEATPAAEAEQAPAEKKDETKADAEKPAEEKPAEQKKVEDKNKDAETQPVDLSDLKFSEGFNISDDVRADLTKLANEQGLTKETAQALVPVGEKIAQEASQAAAARINQDYQDIRQGWRDTVVKDPTIGTPEQLAIANKGLTAYGTPALRKLLDDTGIGDHPEVIRVFNKIGKTLSEDTIVRGGSGDVVNKDAADVLYPTMK